MKFNVYAVRDRLLGYGMPLIRDNDAVASRSFEYDLTVAGSPMASHPDDFQLYLIGEFDTESGLIEPVTQRMVAAASDFVRKDNSDD